ncbi:MAG: hypothetical protein R2744_06145 [Bacteroidales bacterium]
MKPKRITIPTFTKLLATRMVPREFFRGYSVTSGYQKLFLDLLLERSSTFDGVERMQPPGPEINAEATSISTRIKNPTKTPEVGA